MASSFWYPSVDDVLAIHEAIASEYPGTTLGVQRRGDIEFALHLEEGSFDSTPETIHEKAFHLLRMLVANHPFVDANKRTALNTTAVFYFLNGYRFRYDDEIRTILKQLGTDETAVDLDATVGYLDERTDPIDLPGAIEDWREDLIEYGLNELTGNREDPND